MAGNERDDHVITWRYCFCVSYDVCTFVCHYVCFLAKLQENGYSRCHETFRTSSVAAGSSVTLTFDHLTLKLLCESHLRWVTFVPNLGTLGLWVIELFAMGAWFRAGVVYPSKDGHPSRH